MSEKSPGLWFCRLVCAAMLLLSGLPGELRSGLKLGPGVRVAVEEQLGIAVG